MTSQVSYPLRIALISAAPSRALLRTVYSIIISLVKGPPFSLDSSSSTL